MNVEFSEPVFLIFLSKFQLSLSDCLQQFFLQFQFSLELPHSLHVLSMVFFTLKPHLSFQVVCSFMISLSSIHCYREETLHNIVVHSSSFLMTFFNPLILCLVSEKHLLIFPFSISVSDIQSSLTVMSRQLNFCTCLILDIPDA